MPKQIQIVLFISPIPLLPLLQISRPLLLLVLQHSQRHMLPHTRSSSITLSSSLNSSASFAISTPAGLNPLTARHSAASSAIFCCSSEYACPLASCFSGLALVFRRFGCVVWSCGFVGSCWDEAEAKRRSRTMEETGWKMVEWVWGRADTG